MFKEVLSVVVACLMMCSAVVSWAEVVALPKGEEQYVFGILMSEDPDTLFRVPAGANAQLSGARCTVVVEAGGNAQVNGPGSIVYVKYGGTATLSGAGSKVYAELGAIVSVTGEGITKIDVEGFSE